MNKILISNKHKYAIDYEKYFLEILKIAQNELKYNIDILVELSFVNRSEIKNINNVYRNKDSATDIISIPVVEYSIGKQLGEWYLGDIFMCFDILVEQSEKYGHSIKREMLYLFAHGILHLFGFDHIEKDEERKMNSIIDKIMSKINVRREI